MERRKLESADSLVREREREKRDQRITVNVKKQESNADGRGRTQTGLKAAQIGLSKKQVKRNATI